VRFFSDVTPEKRFAQSRDLLRFLLLRYPGHDFSSLRSQLPGIPYRPVRRLGSEFLGKRSALPKRALGSEFLGKRALGSEFLGKRALGSEFLGKRSLGSEFLGKRALGSEFLGKRSLGSEFLGKRSREPNKEPTSIYAMRGSRIGSEFLGKRGEAAERGQQDKGDKESAENLVLGTFLEEADTE